MKSYHDISHDGGSNIAGQVSDRDRALGARLDAIQHVVGVMSGKGGVGKSATAVSLATCMALRGLRVGIVDADINGASVLQMTGVKRGASGDAGAIRPPVSGAGVKVMSIDLFLPDGEPVVWEAPTQRHAYSWRGMAEVNAIREMITDTDWGALDFLFVDLPPGTDKLPNLQDIVGRLSAAVVVSIPSAMSAHVVRKSVLLAREVLGDKPLALIQNMSTFVCGSCGVEHELFPGDHSLDALGIQVLGRVPMDPSFGSALDSGTPEAILQTASPVASAIQEAADGLLTLLNSEPISADRS